MSQLQEVLDRHVGDGLVSGAVALVAGPDREEVAVAGHHDLERSRPMTRDTVFRIASATKPIVAAAVLTQVEAGRLRLDDPVSRWLPETAAPVVVSRPDAAVDDVVPAERPVTVEHLLTSTAGWGMASDFSLPANQALLGSVQRHGWDVQVQPDPDTWMQQLAAVPMLAQPGTAWLYNVCSELQGVLLARLLGRPLTDVLQQLVLGPLGMVDTGFVATDPTRLPTLYAAEDGVLAVRDRPDERWARPPAFPSGAGGLVSTVDDLARFLRVLASGGADLLSARTVRAMTTDHLQPGQGDLAALFLDGQGWGYGGGVDVADGEPWNVPGRYGWVGGTGTAAYVVPSAGTISVVLSQRLMQGPDDFALVADVGTLAARR